MTLPPLLSLCQVCRGLGFVSNPDLPDTILQQRESWCETTWYTAWDAVGETYGGTVLVCSKCGGTGQGLTPAGQQIVELTDFLQSFGSENVRSNPQ